MENDRSRTSNQISWDKWVIWGIGDWMLDYIISKLACLSMCHDFYLIKGYTVYSEYSIKSLTTVTCKLFSRFQEICTPLPFVVFLCGQTRIYLIYPYILALLHWEKCMATEIMKQCWRIWVKNYIKPPRTDITMIKQATHTYISLIIKLYCNMINVEIICKHGSVVIIILVDIKLCCIVWPYNHGSHTSGPTKNKDFSRTFPGPWSN